MISGNRKDGEWKRGQSRERHVTNRFNFLIFKNYDGSTTSKTISREMYNKLFDKTCNSQQAMV